EPPTPGEWEQATVATLLWWGSATPGGGIPRHGQPTRSSPQLRHVPVHRAGLGPPRLIRGDLTLPPQPLILRVLLGPAHVEALAPVRIGIGVHNLAVLGATLEPVGRQRPQALLAFGRIRRPHHEAGRRQ